MVYEYLGKSFQFHALTFLLAFGVYKLLNTLLFDVGDNTTFHLGIYKNNFTSDTVLNNFKYYLTQIFESYFQFWQIPWIGTAACIMFIVLFIRGWGKLKGRYKLIYYILIVQFIMIIFFPFQQGMRYMLPLVPLVIIVVLKSFDLELNRDGGLKYLFLGILGLFFFSNLKGISQVNQYVGESPTWSPSTEQTVEGWDYINEYVDEESVFISAFPRVLTFYTDVNAYNPCVSDNNKIWDDIRRFNTTHIITNVQTNQWVPTLENFIKSNTPVLDTLFINDEVLILKIDNK